MRARWSGATFWWRFHACVMFFWFGASACMTLRCLSRDFFLIWYQCLSKCADNAKMKQITLRWTHIQVFFSMRVCADILGKLVHWTIMISWTAVTWLALSCVCMSVVGYRVCMCDLDVCVLQGQGKEEIVWCKETCVLVSVSERCMCEWMWVRDVCVSGCEWEMYVRVNVSERRMCEWMWVRDVCASGCEWS